MSQKAPIGYRARRAWLGMFIGVFVMVFILVVVVSTIVTFILPEVYAGKARIKVERVEANAPGVAGQPSASGIYDSTFIQTEAVVIQSEKILNQVIERLDLNTVWAAKYGSSTKLKNSESRALLKRMIEVRPARNASLIDITVYSDDKQEAAKIANIIAEVFVDYRRNQREMLLAANAGEYKELTDELKKQLAVKTEDPKADNDKIAKMIERAAQVYMASNGATASLSVEIIEHAEPSLRPVRPNKPLNIALGIIIGAILAFLTASVVVILGIVLRKPAEAEPAQSPPLNG